MARIYQFDSQKERSYDDICPVAEIAEVGVTKRGYNAIHPVAEITEDSTKKECYTTCPVAEITEDGILCSILSSLTIRDAVRTSILSIKFRHLWTYLPNLNFDSMNIFGNDDVENITNLPVEEQKEILEGKANKFIGCVDKFLQYHQGRGIKTFKVDFPLNKKHTDRLDKWVNYAITSGTQDLCLILDKRTTRHVLSTDCYDFPYQLFAGGRGSSIERLCLKSCALRVSPSFDGFHSLKALDLVKVSLNDRVIEDLLSACPVLEMLIVGRNDQLVNLRISNPSGKLKHLCVSRCPILEKVEVSAINLTTFEYFGPRVSFLFRKARQMIKAFIQFQGYWDTVNYFLTELHDKLPLLETLLLKVDHGLKVTNLPARYSKFTNLKHIGILVSGPPMSQLIWMDSILTAAPFLKKFELTFFWVLPDEKNPKEERMIRRFPNCPHNQLETIEMNGFVGYESQIEFAIYMLNNAIALQMMTLDSRKKWYNLGKFNWLQQDIRVLPPYLRSKIMTYLTGEVPPGAKLVIL